MRRPPRGRIPPRPDRSRPSLSLRLGASTCGPPTRGPDRLLGPCFKTGRQGSRQSPADPGRRGAVGTGRGRGPPTRRHRGRSRRAGPSGRPGDPAQPRPRSPTREGRRGIGRERAGAARRPFLGRSAGATLLGRSLGSPTGPPVEGPAWPEPPQPAGLCRRPDRSRAPRPGEVHAAGRGGAPGARPPEIGGAGPRRAPRRHALNLPGPICAALPFASRRLHVLLNSLFRVLFNFPSRYLCSIGLVQVFSLGRSLPPAFGLRYKTTRLPEALVRGRTAPAGA